MVLSGVLLQWSQSWAQTSTSSIENRRLKSQWSTKIQHTQIRVGLQNASYLGANQAYFRNGAASDETVFSLDFENQVRWSSGLSTYLDVRNEYSAQEQWNYIKPKEAYLAWNSSRFGQGAIGRKKFVWSRADDVWKLGVFQPRFNDNKLSPQMAGLTGVFGNFKMGDWEGTLAVLPIFIPDLGPHHTVEDHSFVSKNPWFNPPPPKYNLNGQEGDIRYSTKYEISEIIAHPGFAVKLENQLGNYGLRLAMAYKPMNQILLGFPSYGKVVVGSSGDYMNVTVIPRVVYQKLVSSDVSFKSGVWDVYGSLIGESPDRKESSELETAQQVRDALLFSAGMSRPIGFDGPTATRIDFGFLRVWGGDASDKGYFASPGRTLFERRFNYIEAFSAGVSKYTRFFGKQIELRGQGIVDTMQNGGSLVLSSFAKLNENWSLNVQLESLGLLNSSGRIKDGFFNSYRANDRLALGMAYVF